MRTLYWYGIFLFILLINDNKAEYSIQTLTTIEEQRSNNEPFHKLGEHIIAEFMGCKQNLNNIVDLPFILEQASISAGATVLGIKTHQFQPFGMTGVAVLQESHISIHTWPEHNYVAVDFFTCGEYIDVEKGYEILKQFFKPQYISRIKPMRGFNNEESPCN